ncbi:MAG: hypothetical protein FIA82_08545 [Melioribacter sp.]|nr:hypothetical protein [Melioribacter sp.]
MKKIYNEEENKFSKMLKDLKDLPKIKAPDNFEYNLSTRIQNKNFGTVNEREPQFNWIKFLAPSAAVVSVIILFFIFLPSSQENNNQLLQQSKLQDNQSAVNNSLSDKNKLNSQQSVPSDTKLQSNSTSLLGSNNPTTRPRALSPLNDSRSIKLDDYISGSNKNQSNTNRGNIVNNGEEPSPYDGFIVSEKPDKKTLDRYRAVVDSIKKAQLKADSLKKVQK